MPINLNMLYYNVNYSYIMWNYKYPDHIGVLISCT